MATGKRINLDPAEDWFVLLCFYGPFEPTLALA